MQQQEEDMNYIPEMVADVRAGKMPRRRFIKILTAMGISGAGVGAIAAAASRQFAAKRAPVPHVYPGNNTEQHLQQHDEHLTNQTQQKTNEMQNDYHEQAIVEDSMYSQPFVGRSAIMARKSLDMNAVSDLKINVTNRVVHGNQLTAEWEASGTHTADLPGLPASGRSFSISGVTVVIRHEGKIVREALYYDVAELYRQLK